MFFPPEDSQSAVALHYDETWSDTRWFWANSDNLATHFGYWDHNTRDHAQSLLQMNLAMADRINLTPGDYLIDVGCGLGGTALWLASKYGLRVVGIDISVAHLDVARAHAAKRNLSDRVTFSERSFLSTGYPDETFDVVWAQESICHAVAKLQFLREVFRLLRPGGRLVIEDAYLLDRAYSRQELELIQTWLSGVCCPTLPRATEFSKWAHEEGFVDVSFEDISRMVAPSCRRLRRMLTCSYPFGLISRAIGLRTPIQQQNVRGLMAGMKAFNLGLWIAGLFAARKPFPK